MPILPPIVCNSAVDSRIVTLWPCLPNATDTASPPSPPPTIKMLKAGAIAKQKSEMEISYEIALDILPFELSFDFI